uniref:Integrase, catalytic region, zinc finger, CCHC-type, peptidase aspartic, catalytic n=1 Tax=Tanacetum cinerariifolium TaxID=118510 RepID=A0A6L2P2P5_TANCI|nr:hypothetical protein [Tanacetum cinerariifolium]
MIAILEKSEHNVDFHQIVDFVEACHIRYALTINPTVYVSHVRQFWSTARIETTNERTKILAIVDGFNEFSSNIATTVARIKLLKDKDKGSAELSGGDAPIKGRSLETVEEAGVVRIKKLMLKTRSPHAKDYDAFDSDVDEAPTAQTMFMANLSSADPITDESGPSYDSDILFEVQDHNQYLDDTCAYQDEHVMHESVQLDHIVDLHADYTSVSNMIPYDQYVKDNEEETLKRELHSIKLHLASTINRNKSMVEVTTFPKQDFKQKENKLLADFLNIKSLKEKVEDKLVKQDQSLQTVHMLCRPRPLYNDLNKVAIGYKNLLCLTRAKQAQPALYNGHEILKDNHAPAKVHNAEDTLEIAEITRKKMNSKMTNPKCVTHKVKIAPHDYTIEIFLATFTPQKQLTPEQIYWSNDLMKLKSKALIKRTKVSRPIKAFTLYPPNTPAMLVPKVLPMISQVKIHIFTLIQLFLKFDKTCKKRITLTAITNGERGFEQTKACYLQEVIPFFKTIKDNFEGIQKALTKEVKEMKNVFEELEAELKYQNLKDSIGNNQPTPDKDTPELQVTSSDSECTVKVRTTDSQLTKVTDPVTNLQAQNDLFRVENDKVKHHYKELYDSIKITRAKHIEQVTKLTAENVTLKTSVSKAKVQPPVLTRTMHAVDVEPIVPRLRNNRDAHLDYLRHLKESVETIHDIIEEAKVVRPLDRSIVSACRYTKHSQELLEYAIGTCPQGSQQRAKQLAHTPLIKKKQVTTTKPSDKQDRVTSYPKASGLRPKSNPKTNRILPAKVLGECLEIRDNHRCDHPQSEGQSLHASMPSRLCAQARSVDDMPFRKQACKEYTLWVFCKLFGRLRKRHLACATRRYDSGPIESRVKHLLGSVVWAMMSLGGSIVASLENVNGFLAVYTPSDDLILTDFEQKGVVPEVMLHILEEFIFLLGRHSLNNEIPHMFVCKVSKPWEENPTEQYRLGIFLSKEIFEGGMICIHNAFVHDEDYTYGKVTCITHKLKGFNTLFGEEEEQGIFLKKTGHRLGYLRKVLYESSIEAGMKNM